MSRVTLLAVLLGALLPALAGAVDGGRDGGVVDGGSGVPARTDAGSGRPSAEARAPATRDGDARRIEEFAPASADGGGGTLRIEEFAPATGDRDAAAPAVEAAARAQQDGGTGGLVLEEFSPSGPDGGSGDLEPAAAKDGDGDSLAVETRESAGRFPRAPRVEGDVALRFARDLRFEVGAPDAPAEPVVAGRARATVAVEVEPAEGWHLRLEGRARWRASARRGWTHAKGEFEPELGDAFLDLYSRWVDLRVGNQVLAFGANPAFAPADVLAPSDLRDLSLLSDLASARLPVPAVRAQGEVALFSWRAVYVPFFVPHRYDVTGDDWALLQPGWGAGLPVGLELDPSIEGRVQPRLLETRRPPDSGLHGDVALEVGAKLPWVELGVSWIWMNEKLPQVSVDPELAALIDAQQDGAPLEPALLLSLRNRLAAGERLFEGTYRRQHLFSLEASRLLGPAQLDLDVTASPGQTFVDERLRPVVKPTLSWSLGATQAESSDWVWSIGWRALAVFGVAADEVLALVEPGTARGADRTAWLHLVHGGLEYTSPRWPLTVQLRALFEPVQRSLAVAPQLRWTPREGWTVWAGAEWWTGPAHSALGYFDRNDQVVGGVEVRLF